jgi:hypothetical protein
MLRHFANAGEDLRPHRAGRLDGTSSSYKQRREPATAVRPAAGAKGERPTITPLVDTATLTAAPCLGSDRAVAGAELIRCSL